ncbi:MAG: associated Golgi protein-like protein [Frankiales bacterium]|nr:associated Golgi protein-like protein [Frankiales bacterium]
MLAAPTTSVGAVSTQALPAFLDGQHLVESFGIAGLLLIIFAETGLLLGFFLPGDSLLFAAGYAATGKLTDKLYPNIGLVALGCIAVAILGAQTGFLIGRRVGPQLFAREDSRLFKRHYVTKAEEVVEHYGAGRAIVLARFIPIVRTFINPLVGAGALPARTFTLWNVVGGVLWGGGVTLLGYYLGQVSWIGKNLEIFAVIVVLISVMPIAVEIRKQRRRSA